jgi:hypothetical protein
MFSGLFVVIVMTLLLIIPISTIEANLQTVTSANSNVHEPKTEVIPLDETIGIQKTIILMHVSSDNTLPWGFVEGKIANFVPGYPVIIQIYDKNGDPFHFAQTDVADDGSYEYRFRVRNVDNDKVIQIFEGDYYVNIFKVVYRYPDSNQA